MESIIRWDWWTLFIYLLLAFSCGLLLKLALRCKKNGDKLKIFGISLRIKYFCYFAVLFLLVLFMCTRVIDTDLGGADTLRYIHFFNTFGYTKFVLKDILTMHGWEYIFFNLMYLVRIIGGDYTIFMIIAYTVLVFCYLYYFDKNVDEEDEWFISLLFLIPYLKSMNILRNSLAAAVGLVSLEMLRKNRNILFFVSFIIAYLTHYISVILFAMFLFYKIVPDKFYNSRKKILILSLISFLGTLFSIPVIKKILSLTRYAGYVSKISISPWGYLLYAIVFALIIFSYDDFIKILKQRNHMFFYRMIVFLIIIVPPFAVVNGTQRLLLYFEIPRFIMYGDLYKVYEEKIPIRNKKLFKIIVICIYVLWLVFRIWRMYSASGIMPYKNIFFNMR